MPNNNEKVNNNPVFNQTEDLDTLASEVAKKRRRVFNVLIVVGILIIVGVISLIVLNFKTKLNSGNIHAQTPPTSTSTSSTSTSSTSTSSSTVPALTSATLTCSSNNTLLAGWTIPSGTSLSDTVNGYITDTTVSKQVYTLSPQPISGTTGSYTWTGTNGKDTYSFTGWIQDSSGNKSSPLTSSTIDSSTCSSLASTSTPALSCNTFTVTQNGQSGTTFQVGSSPVDIQSGITDSSSTATIDYSNSQWSTTPQAGSLTPSSNNQSATWALPSSITGSSQQYTLSLSGVTDSNGNSLSSPCTVVLTVQSTNSALPNTGFDLPTYIMLVGGFFIIFIGLIYAYINGLLTKKTFKRKMLKSIK